LLLIAGFGLYKARKHPVDHQLAVDKSWDHAPVKAEAALTIASRRAAPHARR